MTRSLAFDTQLIIFRKTKIFMIKIGWFFFCLSPFLLINWSVSVYLVIIVSFDIIWMLILLNTNAKKWIKKKRIIYGSKRLGNYQNKSFFPFLDVSALFRLNISFNSVHLTSKWYVKTYSTHAHMFLWSTATIIDHLVNTIKREWERKKRFLKQLVCMIPL